MPYKNDATVNRDVCCDKACSGFKCSKVKHMLQKSGSETITGNDKDTCCDKACSGFSCPKDYFMVKNPSTTVGDDNGTCCEPSCAVYECPTHFSLKSKPQKKLEVVPQRRVAMPYARAFRAPRNTRSKTKPRPSREIRSPNVARRHARDI